MTTENQDVTTRSKNPRQIRVTITTTDGTDFTGARAQYKVAPNENTTENIVTKDSDNAGEITVETATVDSMIFVVNLVAADTDALLAIDNYHEAMVTLSDGITSHSVMVGTHTIKESLFD